MALIVYPFTLTANTPENVNQLNSNLNAITAQTNGALDGTNLAHALFADYRVVKDISGGFAVGGTAAATYMIVSNGGVIAATGTPLGGTGHFTFNFDPTRYAVTGLTPQYSVTMHLLTNGTAPAVNFVGGLYPVTGIGGGAGQNVINTIGAVIAGSTATINAPALSTSFVANSTDFTAPSAGTYILAFTTSGVAAANSAVSIAMTLSRRYI